MEDENELLQSEQFRRSLLAGKQKYNGLLKRPVWKIIRDEIFEFIYYCQITGRSYFYLSIVLRALHIVQLFLLTCLPYSDILWPRTEIFNQCLNIITVPFIFTTCTASFNSNVIICMIYYVINFLYLISFFICTRIFAKTAKMSYIFVAIFNFFKTSSLYNLVILSTWNGYFIGNLINMENIIYSSVFLIIGVVYSLIMDIFNRLFYSIHLGFEPELIITYSDDLYQLYVSLISLFALVSRTGTVAKGITGPILCYVSILLLVGFIYIFTHPLGIVLRKTRKVLISWYFIGIIMMITYSTLLILKHEAPLYTVPIFVGLYIIVHIIMTRTEIYMDRKKNSLIEQLASGEIKMEDIKKNLAQFLLVDGFIFGSPYCHSWKAFLDYFDVYPHDKQIWILFARFSAYYIEESRNLMVAFNNLYELKKGDNTIKMLLKHICRLIQQREMNICQDIRRKLTKLQDHCERCRAQMRYIWECVIRSEYVEIRDCVFNLERETSKIESEYQHLLVIYPNNPFVANSYATFRKDVLGDFTGSNKWYKIVKLLRNGTRVRLEKICITSKRVVPTLLSEEQHYSLSRPKDDKQSIPDKPDQLPSIPNLPNLPQNNSNSSNAFELEETKDNNLASVHLETLIKGARIRILQIVPAFVVVFFIIIFPLIILICFLFTIKSESDSNYSFIVTNSAARVHDSLCTVLINIFQRYLSNSGITNTVLEKYNYLGIEPEPNWITNDDILMSQVNEYREVINEFNLDIDDLSTTTEFYQVLIDKYFTKSMSLKLASLNNASQIVNASLEFLNSMIITDALNAIQYDLKINQNIDFFTLMSNSQKIINVSEDFLYSITMQAIIDRSLNRQMLNLVTPISGAICFLISFILLIVFIHYLNKESNDIFSIFKYVPKVVVSNLVQSLTRDAGHSNSGVQNFSAQEANCYSMLKARQSKNNIRYNHALPRIALYIVYILLYIALILIHRFVIQSDFDQMFTSCIYNYATSMIHTQMARIGYNMLVIAITNYIQDSFNYQNSINRQMLDSQINNIFKLIHIFRFGDGNYIPGFRASDRDISSIFTRPVCNVENQVDDTSHENTIYTLFQCYSYEDSLFYMINLVDITLTETYNSTFSSNTSINVNNTFFDSFYVWIFTNSHIDFIIPSIETLRSYAENTYKRIELITVIVLCTVFLALIVSAIGLVVLISIISKPYLFSLRLLLFCEPSVILESRSIMKVISNDYSEVKQVAKNSLETQYLHLVIHTLDPILFLNNHGIIQSVNPAVERVFDTNGESLLNTDIRELLPEIAGFFDDIQDERLEPTFHVDIIHDGLHLHIEVVGVAYTGKVATVITNPESLTLFTVIISDTSSQIAAAKLLEEEMAKSEKLLHQILPDIIVKKLTAGEKDISFAVPSATISFTDIVGFTPWCGSLPASTVMSTLNRIFLEFDRVLRKHETMTKIKCIGDCYMAAGGIFAEINQPSIHAADVIQFGIDIINELKLLNKELNMTLRIRVGVNTGGPIIAGVLGISKPTFDILGPAICTAQQMEQSGTPMFVHIPQHVYEYVYNHGFLVKPKGEVTLKSGVFQTYIVTGSDDADSFSSSEDGPKKLDTFSQMSFDKNKRRKSIMRTIRTTSSNINMSPLVESTDEENGPLDQIQE